MSVINILHLSDLHISKKNISPTGKKLIQDIVKQTTNMDKIILVVSGDIVDKGDYVKYKDGVVSFFTSLKENLGSKIKGVFFVPGNHDKVRSTSNILYSQLCQIENIEITEDIWNLQKENYKLYLDLVDQIKKIFKIYNKKTINTFGVEYCEIDDIIVSFVLFDTSWGTYGGKYEEGKLIIGKYQLDSLYNQYNNLKEKLEEKGKNISLTIGVGHHPISWLSQEEEKIIKKYMIDEEYFDMSIYLCGHIHDMELENWYDNEHSLMTLVTGIGWDHGVKDSNDKDKKDEHRYSIYVLDTNKNSCDIIMRRSQKSGNFISDYSVYVDDEKELGKLCYPLRVDNSNQPFVKMNSPDGDFVKSLFVDVNILDIIQKTHKSMMSFQKKSVELLEFYKREYIVRQTDIYNDIQNQEYSNAVSIIEQHFYSDCPCDSQMVEVFNHSVDVVYELFTAFLQELLGYFVRCFVDCFPNNSNLRAHFRWYNRNGDEYLKLCQYSNIDHEEGPSVSNVSWGGLIEQSYKINNSIIYSVNPQYNNLKPVKWDDFMTIVPSFLKSEQEFRDDNKMKIKRPSMTFGISVLNKESSKKELSNPLYVFEYLNIFQLISDIIDDFINDFNVDYSKYLLYVEEQRRGL